MSKKIAVVGSNFASLIFLGLAQRRGVDVLYFDLATSLGGHFKGIRVGDRSLDLGMNFLDLSYDDRNEEKPLSTFETTRRYGWLAHTSQVREVLEDIFHPILAPAPTLIHCGDMGPDILFGDNLDLLKDKKAAPPDEDKACFKHPRYKLATGVYDYLSYAEASNTNNGQFIHEQFATPWLKKLGVDAHEILARYHRHVWLPLYYPESIDSFIKTGIPDFAPYPLYRPKDRTIAEAVLLASESLFLKEGISRRSQPDHIESQSNGLWSIEGDSDWEIIWCCRPEEILNFLGLQQEAPKVKTAGSPLGIAFFKLPSSSTVLEKTTCIFNTSPHHLSCRLFGQNDGAISVEYSLHRAFEKNLSKETIIATLCSELAEILKITAPTPADLTHHLQSRNAILPPTHQNVRSLNNFHKFLSRRYPRIRLTANLNGFGLSSMNDQVAQSLFHAYELF